MVLNNVYPRDIFDVPDKMQHLNSSQLQAFEGAFLRWKKEAKRADSVLSRQRMWLVFSLLRCTGARLGEVLSLDDTVAFDPEGLCVRLARDDRMREVPVPETLFAEIRNTLDSPMGYGLRGRFFQLDPGYFRRTCYARGTECGLPKELACPRVLRNSRAVEMLRSGVPITVVKDTLGQSSLDLTSVYQHFSQGDAAAMVRISQQDMRHRTSARNSFVGRVSEIRQDSVMAEVVVEAQDSVMVSAVITVGSVRSMRLEVGSPVVATIKAPLVNVVQCDDAVSCSARNRMLATILHVVNSPVMTEVSGVLPDGTEVCALISSRSASEMGLRRGDTAQFWFKALSVVLNTVQL